ncbi:TetR/AcrR family transcriptional regulator [Azospirillum sp. TSO35-2]|uniref:TetR/AcrR family transcriptional regulator n=1 Tax=Azospirillum sp. TSO35-2 TaxID=716796 RepID=UPI000D61CD15|nr:TetR/AcrR family transcriptional regulator [Azospirillum sp. TSO35-2]PWC40917.1 TetR family transcriptional regulator [Azospirillum sp. TSO35-2]
MDDAVDTALRLFHARGYDGVGVAELGAELGIKPPSFYAAFGSKAGLFQRALERYTASDANVFARAQAEGGGVAAVVDRTLALAAQLYPGRADGVAGCLVLDGTRNSADPEARALTAALKRASRAAIRDFIATEAPARADELADFLVIAMAGMSAAARDGADAATLASFAGMASQAFHHAFAAA